MRYMLSHDRLLAIVGTATVIAAALLAAPRDAGAQVIRNSTMTDPAYGYYVPPVGANSVGARLYPSPRPTPPLVGHTYITYEPLNPDQFLYGHSRVYWTGHDDAPPTRTSVRWGTMGAPFSRLLAPPKTATTLKSHIVR